MKQFKLVDNALGWISFLIAAFVYCSTIEPTASFWDCPEFITTGYKLEIGHPPGAPFFMLTANLFSQFASDPTQVALMVNMMSALLSATCIMFLFWTITHLTRKLILKDWSQMNMGKLIAIEASGLVGALIYTFSDTFWFSAVEGEVYAYSSAFTAVVFWLILKWEDHADERPLDCVDHLYDGSEHRCPPAQPALSASHRIGVLLPQISRCQPERFAHCPGRIVCAGGRHPLWRGARHHQGGRMV